MVSEIISSPVANFLQGIRRSWQPSGKFDLMCQRVLVTLRQIPQKLLATFAKSTILSENCQYPLILCQRALSSLRSSLERVFNNLYRHLQEGCSLNRKSIVAFLQCQFSFTWSFNIIISNFLIYKEKLCETH
jgi:hypothetical protein